MNGYGIRNDKVSLTWSSYGNCNWWINNINILWILWLFNFNNCSWLMFTNSTRMMFSFRICNVTINSLQSTHIMVAIKIFLCIEISTRPEIEPRTESLLWKKALKNELKKKLPS